MLFLFCVCRAVLSVHYRLVVICLERANLLYLLCLRFSCIFVTFSCVVLSRLWYLNVSIPDLYLLSYFDLPMIHREISSLLVC